MTNSSKILLRVEVNLVKSWIAEAQVNDFWNRQETHVTRKINEPLALGRDTKGDLPNGR